MAVIQDTLSPYNKIESSGIQYTTCREFNHISRYKGLRQVIHNYDDIENRFVGLETANPFESRCAVTYHVVGQEEENRLDLLAHKYLGSASYAWIIAYFNHIEDGFTVKAGQTIKVPNNVSNLFNQGELLGNINALKLNLGTE